jgi:MSHA pilin protein MshD
MAAKACRPGQRGFTLIELVIFIIVVGVGLAGVLSVFNLTVFRSADPMVRKQMLSIAEALLEEVEMQPFSYCDPTDASVTTAASTADCAPSTVETLGVEAGETRSSSTNPFNNVSDYSGLATIDPVTDISGTHSYADYSATVSLTAEALDTIASNSTPATMEALRITVIVNHGSDSLRLDGYRARHSPNSVP